MKTGQFKITFLGLLSPSLLAMGLVATLFAAPTLAIVEPLDQLRLFSIDLTVDDIFSPGVTFDLNGDGFDDFRVDISSDELFLPVAAGTGGGDPIFTEIATISAIGDNGFEGAVAVPPLATGIDGRGFFDGTFVQVFQEGDEVNVQDSDFVTSAHLYAEGFYDTVDARFASAVVAGPEFANGPFAQIGSTGFVGLSLSSFEGEVTNFGFAEITRGSITIGTGGYQATSGLGATVAQIPEPASVLLLLAAAGCAVCSRRRS